MFGKTKKVVEKAIDELGMSIVGLIGLALFVGHFYWAVMAFQFGSFLMFFVWMLEPCWIVTSTVGFYSLIAEPPQWVLDTFK
ncbi:hypothetical protein [Vibrio owensii]|uniref:hypothetical protein n=1 Tax=Vibrio harveyi group TaxID=717610 RepID=UPI003CC56271